MSHRATIAALAAILVLAAAGAMYWLVLRPPSSATLTITADMQGRTLESVSVDGVPMFACRALPCTLEVVAGHEVTVEVRAMRGAGKLTVTVDEDMTVTVPLTIAAEPSVDQRMNEILTPPE